VSDSGITVFFSGNVASADFLAVNLEPAGSTAAAPTGSLLATVPTAS
jgi:anti-sigma-K factor RskA